MRKYELDPKCKLKKKGPCGSEATLRRPDGWVCRKPNKSAPHEATLDNSVTKQVKKKLVHFTVEQATKAHDTASRNLNLLAPELFF